MEKPFNSSGIFSQDFRHCRFFKRSRMICENGTSNLRNSQTRSSSCQCSTTSIGQSKETMDFVFRIQKKSRNTRKDSRRDTGRFSVLERKRSGMELFSIHQKENGTLKWWNDSKIQVIQYSRVSGLRITVRDNSIHKGLRTRIVPAQGISWDELQNSTWGGRRFWADHSILPRIHAFSRKPPIQSLCSTSWRNNHGTSHWSSDRANSWPIWTWNCNSITPVIDNGHPMLWFPEEWVGSWMKFIFPVPNSDPVQNYCLTFRKQKKENLARDSRRPASRRLVRPMFQVRLASWRLVRTPLAFLPAKRPFSHKEPFLRPRGSGQLFLPILRMEEPCR